MEFTQADIQGIVADEEQRWRAAHAAIVSEIERATRDMRADGKLARELTAEIVNSARDEDKQALASDEAVAHGLTKLRRGIAEDFHALAKQPYFARVVTEEAGKQVEFRLGTASFPEQRIVDWRKAPISQLYYNYREGDEFDEVIQGRERSGTIRLRRAYQGIEGRLNVIELPQGTIRREGEAWVAEHLETHLSRAPGHDGHLPPILSLITPEQFELITRDALRPIVIQGIAGSGKTTVALHRLAWLLHGENSAAKPERCLVVVFNRSLKAYIETTLPELGVEGVAIRTYHQWVRAVARELYGDPRLGSFKRSREAEQFKSSAACLQKLREYVEAAPSAPAGGRDEDLFAFFRFLAKQQVLWPRWEAVASQFAEQAERRCCDEQDDTILLNLVYAREGSYPVRAPGVFHLCDHIVIDEAQDFGAMEVHALLNALDRDRTVTIVGDAGQKIVMNRHFGGWGELLAEAGFAESAPIELTVSHRTTQEIMAVAAHVRGDGASPAGGIRASRRGRPPRLIRAEGYETEPHLIGQWVSQRLEEDARSLSAVICRLPAQAEHLTQVLKRIGFPFVRWGHREQFDFSPGVTVTNAHQVKGLEFRNVLVVNPTETQYRPDSEEDRNLLYVAITRAELTLDFICFGRLTPLLPPLARG